ncbi:LOW QUALITY PROTEIN: testis anion transporter 1 [Podargus strigoides]
MVWLMIDCSALVLLWSYIPVFFEENGVDCQWLRLCLLYKVLLRKIHEMSAGSAKKEGERLCGFALITVGLCNICRSFFKSFVVKSISGMVTQEKTAGRTQGVLAAIVVFNMLLFLEKFLDVPIQWRRDKYHFVICLLTFAAVLCLGLDVGLAIARGSMFFIIPIRSHSEKEGNGDQAFGNRWFFSVLCENLINILFQMKMVVLGQIPNMNIYRSLPFYKAAWEMEGIKIFQCCSSISFTNTNHFNTYLLHKMDMKAVPLDQSERSFNFTLSDTTVERKDLKCSYVCDPPLPPSRLHDTVLAALEKHQKPDKLEPTAEEFAEEPPPEQQRERTLLLKKSKIFFSSAKKSDSRLLHEEPVSASRAQPSSLQQCDTPPLQSDFQDPGWRKRWKYTSNP